MIDLSRDQTNALDLAVKWFTKVTSDRPVFRLFGYAGTGKTSVLQAMVRSLSLRGDDVRFVAPTGKAARVMSTSVGEPAETIHAAYYRPRVVKDDEGRERLEFRFQGFERDKKLIVVDEASMLSDDIYDQLLSLDVPIVLLGDPGQLPPVGGRGVRAMAKPDVVLTEIHRQGGESSIIDIADIVRSGRRVEEGDDGAGVRVVDARRAKGDLLHALQMAGLDMDAVARFDQVIVGRNETRCAANDLMRSYYGIANGPPTGVPHEKLLVSQNHKATGFVNGDFINVRRLRGTGSMSDGRGGFLDAPFAASHMDGPLKSIEADLWLPPFRAGYKADYRQRFQAMKCLQAEWGWAVTAHKSQGSQWRSVLVFDESAVFKQDRHRWLYTAVTRATDELTVIRI